MEKSNEVSKPETNTPEATHTQVDSSQQQPTTESTIPQKANNKWVVPTLIGLLIIAVGVAGYFAYQNNKLRQRLSEKADSGEIDSSQDVTTSDICEVQKTVLEDKITYKIDKYNFAFEIPLKNNQNIEFECDEEYPKNSSSIFLTKDSNTNFRLWPSNSTTLPLVLLEGPGAYTSELKNGGTKIYSYDGEGPSFSCYQLYYYIPVENNENVKRIFIHALVDRQQGTWNCFVPNTIPTIQNIISKYEYPSYPGEYQIGKELFQEINSVFDKILESRDEELIKLDNSITEVIEEIKVY